MLLQLKRRSELAMSTPAPNAMMEPIILFLRLTKDARAAPAISGKLAVKPQSRESNMVPVDEVNYFFTKNLPARSEYKTMMSKRYLKSINLPRVAPQIIGVGTLLHFLTKYRCLSPWWT